MLKVHHRNKIQNNSIQNYRRIQQISIKNHDVPIYLDRVISFQVIFIKNMIDEPYFKTILKRINKDENLLEQPNIGSR